MMKNIVILITPFLIMILVNEITRYNQTKTYTNKEGKTLINPIHKDKSKCTWHCYRKTAKFCPSSDRNHQDCPRNPK